MPRELEFKLGLLLLRRRNDVRHWLWEPEVPQLFSRGLAT